MKWGDLFQGVIIEWLTKHKKNSIFLFSNVEKVQLVKLAGAFHIPKQENKEDGGISLFQKNCKSWVLETSFPF
jgi:hypothetical protein